MPGCDVRNAPASCPYPVTTLSVPGGNPISAASSARRRIDRLASSAGLTTQALPAASDAPTVRPKICIG